MLDICLEHRPCSRFYVDYSKMFDHITLRCEVYFLPHHGWRKELQGTGRSLNSDNRVLKNSAVESELRI